MWPDQNMCSGSSNDPAIGVSKTIVFSWIFPLDGTAGGVERVTQRLMEGLARRGHNCLFLLHDTVEGKFLFEGKDVGELGDFLHQHDVDTLVNQNGYSSAMTEALCSASWRGRYIVCHHNEPMFLRKVYGLRSVFGFVSAHEGPLGTRLTWLARLVAYPLWQWLSTRKISMTQARNYLRADRYVLLSPTFLPQLKKLLGLGEIPKATAIPNPLSFEIAPREAAGFEKSKDVLIVARLNDGEKRISAALAAWRIIERQDPNGWMLKIVGDGPDTETLQGKARNLGLKRVIFVGRQDPLALYKPASIFLMTSRVEGWGLTLTEAMQTGAVPVAFDAYASLRDIIEHGETGVVVANGDVSALADETLRLMRDPERCKTLSIRAIEAAQRYRLGLILDKWEAIL